LLVVSNGVCQSQAVSVEVSVTSYPLGLIPASLSLVNSGEVINLNDRKTQERIYFSRREIAFLLDEPEGLNETPNRDERPVDMEFTGSEEREVLVVCPVESGPSLELGLGHF